MAAAPFRIFTSSAFDRSLKRLARKHRHIVTEFEALVAILRVDPQNLTRRYDINKLSNMSEGQWRIRAGNYRLRYDVEGDTVKVYSIKDRSEAYKG